jgi:hypothetical protein
VSLEELGAVMGPHFHPGDAKRPGLSPKAGDHGDDDGW